MSDKKQKLSDLIVAIFEHPDSPKWLLEQIHDALSDNVVFNCFDPAYIKGMLKVSGIDREKQDA